MNAHADVQAEMIREAAAEAYAATGNYDLAAKRLLEKCAENPELMAALLAPFKWAAAKEAVQRCGRDVRDAAWRHKRPEGDPRISMRAKICSDKLLDFTMIDGTPLRDAVRPQVAATAEFYRAQVNDMAAKLKWLDLVVAALRDDTTPAGEVLTEARLRKMQAGARK